MEHMAGAERGAAQATDGDRLSTFEEVLERWALYDCSAVTNSPGDAEMRELFRQWRATRSKPATVSANVTPQSLDRAWTAFVERWNTEGADEFRRKLEQREADHANLSLSALAAQAVRAVMSTGSHGQVLQHGSASLTLPLSPPLKTK
ncbi:hypothetical protein PPTG_12962 [Phytophthora nicotianae INRA-310]|uniref:Uncharacterized protein n=1 Tax=Phytophthora nicotianae (strain INRA-310) TaxID=761204 RepID=W2Q5S1_PHYN3|nr:hypothetical protein PPTG_12962 [Phytophthora nicotianae INRA-310]ETN07620.1 hypothetical protein PPTG_12962 [Phytophthora nicotianae INRA-310]